MGAGSIVAVGSPYALNSNAVAADGRFNGAIEGRLRTTLLPLLNCACVGDPSLRLMQSARKLTTPADLAEHEVNE